MSARAAVGLASLAAWALAGGPGPVAAQPIAATVAAPQPVAAIAIAPTVEDRLDALAVTDDDFYRSVLYTWTTQDSIADLRASRVLLVATATSGRFTSPFNRALAQLDRRRRGPVQAVAHALVTEPTLLHRRYAWPAPFATVMGLGSRSYGTAVIRIELRPEAWNGRFDPTARQPFRFVDAAHQAVALVDVLAQPDRIAAIYHVRADAAVAARFREYVVCNAGMVARWSIATPDIRAEIDSERALLVELGARLGTVGRRAPSVPRSWAHRLATPSLVERWTAALAFDNSRYDLTAVRLDAIVDALDAYDGTDDPLTQ